MKFNFQAYIQLEIYHAYMVLKFYYENFSYQY